MSEEKLDVGSRVRIIHHPDSHVSRYIGTIGVVESNKYYHGVVCYDGNKHLFIRSELELVTGSGLLDVTGKEINVGDAIVYFTRTGSNLCSQKARVESIGVKRSSSPHILVKREDAVEKDKFTRKAWLWSFNNSVKIN